MKRDTILNLKANEFDVEDIGNKRVRLSKVTMNTFAGTGLRAGFSAQYQQYTLSDADGFVAYCEDEAELSEAVKRYKAAKLRAARHGGLEDRILSAYRTRVGS